MAHNNHISLQYFKNFVSVPNTEMECELCDFVFQPLNVHVLENFQSQ